MSRKKCKRRVWALVDPIRHAMEGCAITSQDRLDKLRLMELSAIDAFAKGRATVSDWRVCCDMLNVSETMALSGIGPEALEANQAAQNAMREVADKGRLLFTGPQLTAMREAYSYADLQRASISRSEFEQQIKKTQARVRHAVDSGKAEIVQVNQGASA
jgi:hypothetical protein